MLRRLEYSKFAIYNINPEDIENAPMQPYPFCEPSEFKIITVIDEPAAQIVYEDWYKGNDTQWSAWTDEIHFVMSGKAEITLWEPPDLENKITVIAEAPCVYLVPIGARIKWHILSDEPFRHIVADIPNPGFGFG